MFIVSLSAFYSNWIRMYSCQMKVGDADKKWFMQEHLIDLCAIHRISLKIWPIRQAFAFFWGVAFVLILQVKDCTISHSHVQINKVNVWLCIFFSLWLWTHDCTGIWCRWKSIYYGWSMIFASAPKPFSPLAYRNLNWRNVWARQCNQKRKYMSRR